MKKAAAYIRVSTADQNNSLEAQQARIREYCAYQKIELIELITDEDVSGGKPIYSRDGGKKIKQLIASGQVNCIVSTKVDRLFRNTVDALTSVAEWNEDKISLHIIDMGGLSVDTSSAAGKMVFTMLVAFSEFERGRTAERTKDVLSHKKKNLKAYSPTPYGFDNIDGQLIPNERQQEGLKLIKELHSKGLSLRKIIDQLNIFEFKPVGGGCWHPSTVKQILENDIHS